MIPSTAEQRLLFCIPSAFNEKSFLLPLRHRSYVSAPGWAKQSWERRAGQRSRAPSSPCKHPLTPTCLKEPLKQNKIQPGLIYYYLFNYFFFPVCKTKNSQEQAASSCFPSSEFGLCHYAAANIQGEVVVMLWFAGLCCLLVPLLRGW